MHNTPDIAVSINVPLLLEFSQLKRSFERIPPAFFDSFVLLLNPQDQIKITFFVVLDFFDLQFELLVLLLLSVDQGE